MRIVLLTWEPVLECSQNGIHLQYHLICYSDVLVQCYYQIVNVEAISARHEAFVPPFTSCKLLQRRSSAIVKSLMSKPFQPATK